ncbi:MAG: hypothetical protein ACRYG2_14655 [Janthinobacterium lividum]
METVEDDAPELASRRRRLVLTAVVSAVAVVALVVAVLGLSVPPSVPVSYAGGGTALPPWPAPVDPSVGEQAAGLKVAPAEGLVQHFHVHLDVLVDGAPVPVPANLGIDVRQQIYAEIHTPADSPPRRAPPRRLTRGDGKRLRAYVDGRPPTGAPARLILVDHQEIVLAYGTEPPSPVPSSFDLVATPT